MQMTKRVLVLVLALIAVIATLALVGVGLSHVQAMRGNAGFIGSTGGRMSPYSHEDCDENMSTHMNATGNMRDKCGDVPDDMNMAGHMMGMH